MNIGVWGWDTANIEWVKVLVNNLGRLQVDIITGTAVETRCHGFDTLNWQYLQVEAAALHNLRVKLYDAGNAIASSTFGITRPAANRGLNVLAAMYGYDGSDMRRQRIDQPNVDDIAATRYSLPIIAFLHGFDGARWDRLRVDAAFRLLTNAMLYDGANAIDSDQLDSNIFVSGDRGILVRGQICGYNLEPFHQRRTDSDALAAVSRELCLMSISALYGYNGATFDRLRTYGTGILKVGRAEIGLLTIRMINVGQAGAAGARKLYWMALNPGAGHNLLELTDDTDGSTAVVFDHFDTARDGHMMTLDPPMEFTNGIWVKTFTNLTSAIFGYL